MGILVFELSHLLWDSCKYDQRTIFDMKHHDLGRGKQCVYIIYIYILYLNINVSFPIGQNFVHLLTVTGTKNYPSSLIPNIGWNSLIFQYLMRNYFNHVLGLLGASIALDAAVGHVAGQQMAELGAIQAEVSTRLHHVEHCRRKSDQKIFFESWNSLEQSIMTCNLQWLVHSCHTCNQIWSEIRVIWSEIRVLEWNLDSLIHLMAGKHMYIYIYI